MDAVRRRTGAALRRSHSSLPTIATSRRATQYGRCPSTRWRGSAKVPLVPPDHRYAKSRDAIQATTDKPEIAGIAQALSTLWAFDERFFGDPIGGGEPDFR